MKQKEYTADELLEIIKEKGIVMASLTKDFKTNQGETILNGTILFFGKEEFHHYISSFDRDTLGKNVNIMVENKVYGYSESWHGRYKGKFILLDTQEIKPNEIQSSESEQSKYPCGEEIGTVGQTPEIKIIESIPTKLEYKGRIYILEQ